MARLYTVRRLKIGRTEQMDALSRAAGHLYSQVVVWFWRTVRHKDLWLKAKHLMRWLTSALLHAHSSDAVVQSFFAALASWQARRKSDPHAHPPRRRKRFYRVQWKATAIQVRNGLLFLSNGKGIAPLVVPWRWDVPCLVEMGWDGTQYELRATYRLDEPDALAAGAVAGIDLGEVHPAVAHDGTQATLLNGRHLRSVRRYQNKIKARLAALRDRKKRRSHRHKRLVASMRRQLRRLDHQMKDIAHKQTSRLVSTLHERGVQTVAIGDIRDIRHRIDYGHKANEKLHQMPSGLIRHLVTYKAQRRGMQVVLQNERYTSQTCPSCTRRHKPHGRRFRCPWCGFVAHRDVVGAWNIRKEYLGTSPVAGAMASPIGVRYQANMRCSTLLPPSGVKESWVL
jgi:putative transposase